MGIYVVYLEIISWGLWAHILCSPKTSSPGGGRRRR